MVMQGGTAQKSVFLVLSLRLLFLPPPPFPAINRRSGDTRLPLGFLGCGAGSYPVSISSCSGVWVGDLHRESQRGQEWGTGLCFVRPPTLQ